MKKLSFAVAVLCGLTRAGEFQLPSVTYDDKAVLDVFNQTRTFWRQDEQATQQAAEQDWIDLNHVVATARAQVYVNYGKHVKPWVDAWAEWNRLTTVNTQCDANKLEQCIFQAQMDMFNGRYPPYVREELSKCVAQAKCDSPAFTEGMHSFESKVDAAERNDEKLLRDGENVVGHRLGKALDSHFQRWEKVNQAKFDHFKTVVKTAGCDVDCVQKCSQTPHYYSFEVAPESGKYYIEADPKYTFNGTHVTSFYYQGVESCGYECKCFENVKINWGSIHYQKIAEEEYGKPIGQFTEKERAQLAQSLNAYEEQCAPKEQPSMPKTQLFISQKQMQAPQGIYESQILKTQAQKESLDKEIKKMGKKGTPELLYKASRGGFNSSVLWQKCLGQDETITLVQTNFNTVIGGYMPEQWEDTTGMRSYDGRSGFKDIVSGSPFLFYWVKDEIQIIKHRNERIPYMGSDKDWLLVFGQGLYIYADKNKVSEALERNGYWVRPQNTGNLGRDINGALYFAGGYDEYFYAMDIEVWGLH